MDVNCLESLMKSNLYNVIGETKIRAAIANFYEKAFRDPIIGHQFFHSDIEQLIEKQSAFTISAFGGPKCYQGRDMREAHRKLPINKAQFDRRQVLMAESLDAVGIPNDEKKAWLDAEDAFRSLVISTDKPCHK